MYFVGKIVDKSFVEASGTYGSMGDPPNSAILGNVIGRLGGVSADYAILHISDASPRATRVMEGDEYDLVWTANAVTDIDFATKEDNKRWLNCAVSKNAILADNTDTLTLTLELWKPDKSGIATNASPTENIEVQTPIGTAICRAVFVNGVCTKTVRCSMSGTWRFPANGKRSSGYRVMAAPRVDALLTW